MLLCNVTLSVLLVAFSVIDIVPIAHAQGTNLVANPSAETSASSKPTGWSSDKWGSNTVSFTYKSGGHDSAYSLNTNMTKHRSGDAKWYFAPVTVPANTSYSFTDWYQSDVKTSIDAEVTSTTEKLSYLWLGDTEASSQWKQNSLSFTTPADAAKVTIFHSISAVGNLTVDDYSLATTAGETTPPPTAPTVSVTAPASTTAVNGMVTLSADATDQKDVQNVQFQIDGANVGVADSVAPYNFSWDSTTIPNGSHTITARHQ